MTPLERGSPVRYYAATAPVTFPALIAATVAGWHDRSRRPWLVTATALSISGAGITAYLVRAVNLDLFFRVQVTAEDRENLLRTWHRLNMVRLAVTGSAWLAARRAE